METLKKVSWILFFLALMGALVGPILAFNGPSNPNRWDDLVLIAYTLFGSLIICGLNFFVTLFYRMKSSKGWFIFTLNLIFGLLLSGYLFGYI